MNKTSSIAASLVLGLTAVAGADTSVRPVPDGTIGVGAELQLNGLGGASVNYDAGKFHVGGFFGFEDGGGDNDTDFAFGARFYYHVHSSASADFSIGGSFGLESVAAPVAGDPDNRATGLWIEPGIQVRAFIAKNVALSFSTGLSIGLIDANGVSIGGQVNAVAGVHYYFF